jgi:hypothetical protein
VHRISAVSLVALKSENLSMAGTGSYCILCIEYTLYYTVTSLVQAKEIRKKYIAYGDKILRHREKFSRRNGTCQ